MQSLTADFFEPLVGKPFVVLSGGNREAWQVTNVMRREAHALRSDSPFNVYLDAPASLANRAQGIRQAVFDSGETFDFFAVPVAAKGDLVTFEVIFN
jgi:hypothetical protein